MKRFLLGVLAGAMLAGPASAASYLDITINGIITSQLPCTPGYGNTCQDANLGVGSQLTLSAAIDESTLVPDGDDWIAVTENLSPQNQATGIPFYQITGPNGLLWQGISFEGGDSIWHDSYIVLDPNFNVIELAGDLLYGPELLMSDSPQNPTSFSIIPPAGAYGDDYQTPGFLGQWDLAGAVVTDPTDDVPEPATWALMLAGLTLAGASLRYRKSKLLPGGV